MSISPLRLTHGSCLFRLPENRPPHNESIHFQGELLVLGRVICCCFFVTQKVAKKHQWIHSFQAATSSSKTSLWRIGREGMVRSPQRGGPGSQGWRFEGASSDSFLKIAWTSWKNVGFNKGRYAGICGERSLHSGNIADSWFNGYKKNPFLQPNLPRHSVAGVFYLHLPGIYPPNCPNVAKYIR